MFKKITCYLLLALFVIPMPTISATHNEDKLSFGQAITLLSSIGFLMYYAYVTTHSPRRTYFDKLENCSNKDQNYGGESSSNSSQNEENILLTKDQNYGHEKTELVPNAQPKKKSRFCSIL